MVLQLAQHFLHVSRADPVGDRVVIFLTGLAPGANRYGQRKLDLSRSHRLRFPLLKVRKRKRLFIVIASFVAEPASLVNQEKSEWEK